MNKRKLLLRFIVVFVISAFVVSLFIPVKYSINRDDISAGLIIKRELTTGPRWKIVEIIGDNEFNLAPHELVNLSGIDPNKILGTSVMWSYQNAFFITISDVNMVYDELWGEYYHELTVISWDICYPIVRELGIFSYSRSFLNIYDFRWFD